QPRHRLLRGIGACVGSLPRDGRSRLARSRVPASPGPFPDGPARRFGSIPPELRARARGTAGPGLGAYGAPGQDALEHQTAAASLLAAATAALRPRIRSDARSAIMIVGAFVLPRTSVGMTEASTTRRPSIPRTRSSSSTTRPIAQVPTGW